MIERECYGIVKTKLLPIFRNFIFGYEFSGYCDVLQINYNCNDIELILNFIRKYSKFEESEQYTSNWWFKPYVYYPRYKLLKKAIKTYKEARYHNKEYQVYLFVKKIVYSEFKKIIGRKYPSIHSYLSIGLGLDEDINSILEFIETYSKNTEFDLINLYNYNYRKKIIKKALKTYEKENYI